MILYRYVSIYWVSWYTRYYHSCQLRHVWLTIKLLYIVVELNGIYTAFRRNNWSIITLQTTYTLYCTIYRYYYCDTLQRQYIDTSTHCIVATLINSYLLSVEVPIWLKVKWVGLLDTYSSAFVYFRICDLAVDTSDLFILYRTWLNTVVAVIIKWHSCYNITNDSCSL